MNPYKFASSILLLLLVAMGVHYVIKVMGLQGDLRNLNDYVLGQDTLLVVTQGIAEQRAIEMKNLRIANRALADSIPELAERNRQLNRRLQTWSSLVAHYEAVIDSGSVVVHQIETPTTKELSIKATSQYLDASLNVIVSGDTIRANTTLTASQNGVKVQYWLNGDTKDYYLSIIRDPLILHFVLSQDISSNWVADWKVPDYITVDSITTLVVPYKISWWEKVGLTLGATTEPAGIVGLTYSGWTGGLYLTESARHLYASRTWYLGRFLKRR